MHSNDYLLNIENDIKELEKVLINEKNPQKYLITSEALAILKSEYIYLKQGAVSKKFSNIQMLKIYTSTIPEYEKYLPYVELIYSVIDRTIDNIPLIDEKENNYQKDEIIRYARQFYLDNTPSIIFNKIERILKNTKNYIDISKKKNNSCVFGEFLGIPILNKMYITVNENNKADAVNTLIHELGHAIVFLNNEKKYYNGNYLFREISPFLMELINDDYYKSNIKYNRILTLYNSAYDVLSLFKLCKIYLLHNCPTNNKFEDILINNDVTLFGEYKSLNSTDVDIEEKINIIISFFTSLELYMIYKENSKEAFEIYNKIIKLDNSYDEIIKISEYVDVGKNINAYIKKL